LELAKRDKDKDASLRTLPDGLRREKRPANTTLSLPKETLGNSHEDVKLSEHVGNTVTISGKVWHADMHGAKEKTKEAEIRCKEHGHLNATDVAMVSDSCKEVTLQNNPKTERGPNPLPVFPFIFCWFTEVVRGTAYCQLGHRIP